MPLQHRDNATSKRRCPAVRRAWDGDRKAPVAIGDGVGRQCLPVDAWDPRDGARTGGKGPVAVEDW